MTTVRTDCRHHRTDRPCRPHKIAGARCATCDAYDPIVERLLVVKLGAMGDVLRTTSCLAPLKARRPHCHVTWVTRPESRPLLAGNPAIDRVLTIDEPYLELLLVEEFDLVLGLETDLLSASIARLARAGERRGFVADGRGGVQPVGDAACAWWHLGLDDALKRANRRTYGEWLYDVCGVCPPVAPPSLAVGDAAHAHAASVLAARAPDAARRVCVNVGGSARWRQKRWATTHYGDFARLVRAEEPHTALVLVGGPDEASLHAELLASDAGFVDGGATHSVEEFAAVVAACDWMLTSDSLGYHVACAVGTPSACLVGPTSPWELDRHGRNLIVHSDVPCIACYLGDCPLPRTCMDVLSPARLWEQISAWRAVGSSGAYDRVVAVPTGGDAR